VTRKTTLITVGASIVLLVAWFVLLWGPQGGKLADAQAREEVAVAANAELELRRDRLVAAQADAPALQAKVESLRVAVPDSPELAQLILNANDAAAASGVDFLSISPTPPAASLDPLLPAAVSLSITVDVGYFQVLDYLNRIDDMERIVVVDTLALTPNGGEESAPTGLSAALTARTFTTAAPEALPGVARTPVTPTSTDATTTTTPTTTPEATP
jgi:Tfp pilus assembly protein PilO